MTTEFLDWIVAMDFAHYKTEEDDNKYWDVPSGASHWYIKRSSERFTSEELLQIYSGEMTHELRDRWNWSLTDRNRK
jgi:hypothetical protein